MISGFPGEASFSDDSKLVLLRHYEEGYKVSAFSTFDGAKIFTIPGLFLNIPRAFAGNNKIWAGGTQDDSWGPIQLSEIDLNNGKTLRSFNSSIISRQDYVYKIVASPGNTHFL